MKLETGSPISAFFSSSFQAIAVQCALGLLCCIALLLKNISRDKKSLIIRKSKTSLRCLAIFANVRTVATGGAGGL